MPTSCDITFDHLDGIYNSGDTINGQIKLTTTKTKSIRGIYIKVSGFAHVKWEERRTRSRNGKSESYTVYYSAHEQYLNSITYVAGQDCGDSFDFPPGTYDYTISCALPADLPTSCHETYGKIKYEVSVTIDRRLRFDNEFSKPFTVNHILDLNLDQQNRLPVSRDDHTSICCCGCCCCIGDEIHGELNIPFGATITGDTIPFKFLVTNDSNSDIDNCKVKFKKIFTFTSTTPSTKCKTISVDIDTKLFNTVLRYTRKEFKGVIQVPTDLQCTQRGKCINVEYYIKAKVYMHCCTNDIEIAIPVVIGTIPFSQQTNDPNVITTQPTAPLSSILLDEVNSSSPLNMNSLDLPTYEEVVNNHSDDETRKINNNKYRQLPTYNESNNFEYQSPPENNINNGHSNTAIASASSSSSTTVTMQLPYGWK